MTLNRKSQELLQDAHPDLQRVVYRCAESSGIDFIVTEVKRTLERQKQLKAAGASQTLRSRHIPNADGDVCAVDLTVLVDGEVRWDWPLYAKLAVAMKAAAKQEGVMIEWGGDWLKFKDGPHFQLPWSKYP